MHYQAEILTDLLIAHGVTDVFVSPGSRNAPLVESLMSRKELNASVVSPDERTTAFVALGYAAVAQRPVAIVCTSGTAVLDYAPAVAEAFYRRIPLIVISADRPRAWIDQDDSQTLRQNGVIDKIVKRSYDIGPVSFDHRESEWYADREINDALNLALAAPMGPVHLNIHIGSPSVGDLEYRRPTGRIEVLRSRPDLEVSKARELAERIKSPRKVLIVCAVANPSGRMSKALGRLSEIPNVAVVAESVANVSGRRIIPNPDAALAACPDQEHLYRLIPDVVITLGGAIVSARIKKFLRSCDIAEHWQVGERDVTADCFCRLTMQVQMDPGQFLQQLAAAMQPQRGGDSKYSDDWEVASRRGLAVVQSIAAKAPWSDLKAMSVINHLIPRRWNVELSNGTTVRYACILPLAAVHRCGCNRGVSGIDGSTSTAIGAAMAYTGGTTLLITGDMSALYDLGAFGVLTIPDSFRMVVLDNGGGGIFRSIPATRDLACSSAALSIDNMKLPLSHLAAGFGFEYFEAADETALREVWPAFSEARHKSILRVVTPPEADAATYSTLFENFSFSIK